MEKLIKSKKNFVLLTLIIMSIIASCCIYKSLSASAAKIDIQYKTVLSLNGSEKELKYIKTYEKIKDDYLTIYSDDSNDEYLLKDNKIVGYLQDKEIDEIEQLSGIENKKIYRSVDDIKKDPMLSGIDFNNYSFDGTKYIDSYKETLYTFSKYINGIKTNDGIYVSINDDGSVSAFGATRQHLFDNLITSVTKEDVENYIANEIKKYNASSYDIESMIINYVDEKYVVECLIGLDYEDYRDTATLYYNM